MGRRRRTEYAGAIHHVTVRGNARSPIFLDAHDRRAILDRLARTVDDFGWVIRCYCVMPNHYHAVIETPEPNLRGGMRYVNGSYAQRFNARYDRTGHVFEGPYHASPVEREEHFWELMRYVVLNPVRAALCARPEDWHWSSYRASVGFAVARPWLTLDWLAWRPLPAGVAAGDHFSGFVYDGMRQPVERRDASRAAMHRDLVPRRG